MRWSGPLDELRRRYLAQQVELGGAEVILGAAAAAAAANESSRHARAGGDGERAGRGCTADPKWLKGAPPIPGPGLTITSADPVLLGNDLAALSTLDAVAERIRTTYCCGLCPSRTNAVPGEGDPRARMMLVGEGPGATEDATGRPFVGQAGQAARRHSRGY